MIFPLNFNHELIKDNKARAILRFAVWQLKSRMYRRDLIHSWIDGSKFYVKNGETGLTQNIYAGLHEFEDMGFLLHCLNDNDEFIDIGANSGSYSILAGAVCGARVLAIEPVGTTFQRLVNNFTLNGLDKVSKALNVGLGASSGTLVMTSGLDTTNQIVLGETEFATVEVQVVTLDEVTRDMNPTLIKMDVEGWETEVVRGGSKTLSNPSLLGIIIELNESGFRYGYRDSEIVSSLKDFGFLPFSYDPRNRILKSLEKQNPKGGNTIFVRNQSEVIRRMQIAPKRQVLRDWI